ncbi:RNA-guided endonuclease InsQ/TnpB family protein [Paraburkholderia hospita]|uniref:RNA-guided endonuclease InsQ/TnpB family protein n=1 Tax=Paraburkholderia hospita TaxID=169430 RepID=UPI000B341E2C|nr:RNA-guided endonuclease TnpB family protein [Paraburkholderia hospita]OUL88775.1 transposase [Paraburkholderia hospita]
MKPESTARNILGHCIELIQTPEQADYFARACGTHRFTWNWALAEWNRQYASGGKPSAIALKKQFNAIKYQQFPWLKDIHRDAHAQPFTHLGKAWKRFFADVKAGKLANAPQFKRKGSCQDSFYVANDKFTIARDTIRLPLVGEVKMREALRYAGKIMGATVSRSGERWFVSVQVEVTDPQFFLKRTGSGVIGVDLGLKAAATLSTGQSVQAPKPLKASLRRLRIRSRRMSRKLQAAKVAASKIHGPQLPGRQRLPVTNNRRKSSMTLARLHARIANVRADFTHKLTTRLCRENQTVVIEDLNVRDMLANEKLARAISDVGFGRFRAQMQYKAKRYGTDLILADRFYPSSRLCCVCGWKNRALTLNHREWTCNECGTHHDRDINAARNLKRLATATALPVASHPATDDAAAGKVPVAAGKVTPVRYECGQQDASGQEENRAKLYAHS